MKPSDERYTPEWLLNIVRAYAPIACDPCTTRDNRTRAEVYYHAGDCDCEIEHEWPRASSGVCWVNPPYSRGELARWVGECISQAARGSEVIALLPGDLGTRAGQTVASSSDAICFVRGRIVFGGPDGYEIKTGAKQPSVLAYFGDRAKRFGAHFGRLGVVWQK